MAGTILAAWSVVAAAGSAPVLSYAILADFVPKEITGRANGALNLFHFAGAFAVQYVIGVIVALWPSKSGHYPAIAYETAFGLNLSLQTLALVWFVCSWGRGRWAAWVSSLRHLMLAHIPPAPALSTRSDEATSRDRHVALGRQVALWRLAGLGSASLTVLLGLILAISVVRANVLSVAVVTARRDKFFAALPAVENTLADAQIAYALADFVRNVRSLSLDPIVVRANWIDALDHVTSRGAKMLNDYARDESPFIKIGRRTVTVAVTNVVRATEDTFDISWEERIVEAGAAIMCERFVGVTSIVLSSPNAATLISKNPLGLYVDKFTWQKDSITNDSRQACSSRQLRAESAN